MRNLITEIYENLTDEQLKEAILEIKEDEQLGIIRIDGWVRKLTKQTCEITGETNISTHLFLTSNSLFREASFRFIK